MPAWSRLHADHEAACRGFYQAALAVPAHQWPVPAAPGKWSPAEITAHLVESYRVLRLELSGAAGMRVVVPPMKRWLLRVTVLPRLLRTGRFAPGIRAPKETRPGERAPTAETGVAALQSEVRGFVQELDEGVRRRRVTLTHAYFGRLSGPQALRLCTIHVAHHTRQLSGTSG
jgi:hypothetical protein